MDRVKHFFIQKRSSRNLYIGRPMITLGEYDADYIRHGIY